MPRSPTRAAKNTTKTAQESKRTCNERHIRCHNTLPSVVFAVGGTAVLQKRPRGIEGQRRGNCESLKEVRFWKQETASLGQVRIPLWCLLPTAAICEKSWMFL